MNRKVYRAFNAEQIALLESLRQEPRKDESEPIKGQRNTNKPADPSLKKSPRLSAPSVATSQAASSLAVDPAHAKQAKKGDFTWIPTLRNHVIEHMLRIKNSIYPRRDQLVVVGHLYWKSSSNSSAATDTIYVGSQLHRVSIARMDAAVEYAFSEMRLAWIARISRGEAISWDPVYIRVLTDPLKKSHELHFTIASKRERALQAALRSGILCLAVLSKEVSLPRTRPIGKEKSSRPIEKEKFSRPKKGRKIKAPHFKIHKPASTYQDGSALIPAPTGTKRLAREISGRLSASTLPSKTILPQSADNRPYVIEWCLWCNGGELPNCPQCDGVGSFKRYETDSPSKVIMERSPAISRQMSTPIPVGKPSSVADHEAVGRSDPLDANRGTSSIRDRGQFGSMPLHDNYDD